MNKTLTAEEKATSLKRLQYRSQHRGCKEMDIVFSRMDEAALSRFSSADLQLFEALLEEDDADIWNWLTEQSLPVKEEYQPLLAMLRNLPPQT